MPSTRISGHPAPSFRLSLHIRHPSLGPAEISRELELEADEWFAAGEPRRARGGAVAESVHAETYWAAALDPEQWLATIVPVRSALRALAAAGELDSIHNVGWMLSAVCRRLRLRHGEFLRHIQAEGGSTTLRATVSPRALEGFKIPPQTSQWLSELGMTLELEYLGS